MLQMSESRWDVFPTRKLRSSDEEKLQNIIYLLKVQCDILLLEKAKSDTRTATNFLRAD